MSLVFTENRWGESFIDELHRLEFVERNSSEFYARNPIVDFTQTDTLFILIGSDSGLLLKFAENAEIGRGSRVVVIEPDKIFECLQATGHFEQFVCQSTDDDLSIGLYRESDWYEKVFGGMDFQWFCAGKVLIEESHSSRTDYTQIYHPVVQNIRRLVERRCFETRMSCSHKNFIDIQIKNAADNQSPLLMSETFGKGHTAVVLGGGPSLDENIDWIMSNREKLFIITVSRLCQRLQTLKIKPDLVVNIDPYVYSYDASKHGLLWDDVALASSYHAVPTLIQQWRGPAFYLGNRLPWVRFDDQSEVDVISATGPTVGHTATIVASQLGFTQILLSGMDHCYSQSLKTHAKGTPESVIQSLPTMYDAQVETYSGKMAGTQECYVLWIRALEKLGATINQYTNVVFNLSENAARVSSIPHKPVNQIELSDLKPSTQQLIDRCICTNKTEDLDALRAEVRTARRGFSQIQRLCRISSHLIDQMYPTGATESIKEPAEKLDRVEAILESRFTMLMKLIRIYAAAEFFSVQKPSGFDGMSLEERESWIRQYYQIIESVTKIFILMLDDSTERLQSRLLEYSKPEHIDELMQYWKKDGTPGRILRHFTPSQATDLSVRPEPDRRTSELLPSTDTDGKYTEAASAFLEQVAKKQTVLAKKLKSHNDNISHNIRSLLFLFNSGNSTDLKVLIENLGNVSWPANVLSAFCQGLVSELDKDPATSVSSYQQVVELCGERLESEEVGLDSVLRILEESLVRMTQNYLNMKDHASACTALGMLSEMLPRYVTSYAKLLKLTGNAEFAIDLLKLYIENYPYEWRAATVLADTYEHLGRHDEAANAISISKKMREEVKQANLNSTKRVA